MNKFKIMFKNYLYVINVDYFFDFREMIWWVFKRFLQVMNDFKFFFFVYGDFFFRCGVGIGEVFNGVF